MALAEAWILLACDPMIQGVVPALRAYLECPRKALRRAGGMFARRLQFAAATFMAMGTARRPGPSEQRLAGLLEVSAQ